MIIVAFPAKKVKKRLAKEQKTEWLNKFFKRMSTSIYKWSISAPSVIVEQQTINGSDYHQPICTGKINYNLQSQKEIELITKQFFIDCRIQSIN